MELLKDIEAECQAFLTAQYYVVSLLFITMP